MKNWQRVIICVILIMSVFAMSISIYAVNEPTPTTTPYPGTDDNPLLSANDGTIAFLVWTMLQSWGIDVQFGNIQGYTQEVQQQILNWIYEFLDDQPSVETILAWCLDWWWGTDFWGNFVANDTLLDDVEAFASWLETKYGLTNNSTVVLNPQYSINGYTLYNFNTLYDTVYTATGNHNSTYIALNITNSGSDVIGYFLIFNEANNTNGIPKPIPVTVFHNNSERANTLVKYLNSSTGVQEVTGSVSERPYYQNSKGYWYSYSGVSDSTFKYDATQGFLVPSGNNPIVANTQALDQFLNNFQVQVEGDYSIVTYNVILPINDPSYTQGDGITIVDGQPNYGEITLPDSVSVDNLPAIVSTNRIENPHLEEAYRPIQGLIEYAKDGISVGTALLYELPDELVFMWYAVIASLVVWGMIKLMREH